MGIVLSKQQLVVETHMLTEITQNVIAMHNVLHSLITSIDHTLQVSSIQPRTLWDNSTTYSPRGK